MRDLETVTRAEIKHRTITIVKMLEASNALYSSEEYEGAEEKLKTIQYALDAQRVSIKLLVRLKEEKKSDKPKNPPLPTLRPKTTRK